MEVFQPHNLLRLLAHELGVHSLRDEGRTDLLVAQLLQVELAEEGVREDLVAAICTEAPGFIFLQQLLNYIFCDVADTDPMPLLVWPSDFGPLDVQEHYVAVLVVEGRDPCEHFVDEDAEGPPVRGVVMAGTKEHFGRNVLRRAAKRV